MQTHIIPFPCNEDIDNTDVISLDRYHAVMHSYSILLRVIYFVFLLPPFTSTFHHCR